MHNLSHSRDNRFFQSGRIHRVRFYEYITMSDIEQNTSSITRTKRAYDVTRSLPEVWTILKCSLHGCQITSEIVKVCGKQC